MIAVHRCTRGQVDFFRCLWRPALCTAMMALAARSAFTLLGRYVSQNLAVAAAIAAAAAVYAVMALPLGAVISRRPEPLQKWAKCGQRGWVCGDFFALSVEKGLQ